jgi:hypothetical protein
MAELATPCQPDYHEGDRYECGLTVQDRRPRENLEDGCPGGLKVCRTCIEVFDEYIREAYAAQAIRQEHREE